MNIAPPPLPDRHAEAIAQVTSMRDMIATQHDVITKLQRELANTQDRVAILTEERARWRTDAMACRTFVVKLATILEHVNTATVGASRILDEMAIMDAAETPKQSVDETTKTVEEQLRKIREVTDGAPVETVSEGTRANAAEYTLHHKSMAPKSMQGV